LQSISDPFGRGPFEFLRREDGFELRSKLADHGYKGRGLFAGVTTYLDTSALGTGPFFYRLGVQE
jgi:hypothetical protein